MGVFDNLGYIAEAQHYPCASPDPWLVIKAGASAIAPVLLSAASFGCTDIIKMRAGVSPWHSRGIRALIEGAISPSEKSTAGKILKFTIPIEKALFFWFVVDLTTEFFARWQSNLFQLQGCGTTAFGCSMTGKLGGWACPSPGAWTYIGYEKTSSTGRCPVGFGIEFGVQAHQHWSCYFSLSPAPIIKTQPIGSFQTRLRRVYPDGYVYEGEKVTPSWIGNKLTSNMMLNGHNKHGTFQIYRFEATADVAAYGVDGSAAVTISDFPLFNKGILPVNCFGAPSPTAAGSEW